MHRRPRPNPRRRSRRDRGAEPTRPRACSPYGNVRGEWERYRFDAPGDKTNADMLSIGLNYRV